MSMRDSLRVSSIVCKQYFERYRNVAWTMPIRLPKVPLPRLYKRNVPNPAALRVKHSRDEFSDRIVLRRNRSGRAGDVSIDVTEGAFSSEHFDSNLSNFGEPVVLRQSTAHTTKSQISPFPRTSLSQSLQSASISRKAPETDRETIRYTCAFSRVSPSSVKISSRACWRQKLSLSRSTDRCSLLFHSLCSGSRLDVFLGVSDLFCGNILDAARGSNSSASNDAFASSAICCGSVSASRTIFVADPSRFISFSTELDRAVMSKL
ncbi:hypothetical protein SDJN02_08354, partial [Cucurbita argyrosperma subsp. argyrosperma]